MSWMIIKSIDDNDICRKAIHQSNQIKNQFNQSDDDYDANTVKSNQQIQLKTGLIQLK